MNRIYRDIYDNVFCNIKRSTITVFLCGACSTEAMRSYRDDVRDALADEKRLSVLYPEDLFIELLQKEKYDLLTLERFLANDSDFIVIACESTGSYTELGAFVNNDNTCDKVVVLLENQYENAQSFVRLGPVEYVKSKKRERVIFYNSELKRTISKLRKIFFERSFVKLDRFKDIDTITGQYNFMLTLLYFYDTLSYTELDSWIGDLYRSKGFDSARFEMIFKAAIRRLFHENLIYKDITDANRYKLTEKGYDSAKNFLVYSSLKSKTKTFNRIRMSVMYQEAYK